MSQVYIDLQDGSGFRDITEYVKYDTLVISTKAFNDSYKYAQNTCDFTINYDSTLYNLLLNNTNDILVVVTRTEVYNLITENGFSITTEGGDDLSADVGDILFTGHAIPSKQRTYNGILNNTSIDISATDKLDTLNRSIGDVVYLNYTVYNPLDHESSLVHKIAAIAGWPSSAFDSSVTISTVIPAFAPNSENDSILSILDTLLHEYGYVLNIDKYGNIHPVLWQVTGTPSAVYEFNDSNIIQEISISDSIKQYDGVKTTYYEMGTATKVRLFTDSNCPFADDGTFSGCTVLSGTYYPPEANTIDITTGTNQIVYQDYTDTNISYRTNYAIINNLDYNYSAFQSDFSSIVATTNQYTDRRSAGLTVIKQEFFNKKCRLLYKNEGASAVILYYNDVYGDVYYKSKERTLTSSKNSSPINLYTYTMQFVFDKAIASAYASYLMAQYASDQNVYEFLSADVVPEGSVVHIILSDSTNKYGLIRERKWDEKTEQYSYIITACATSTVPLISQGISQKAVVSNAVITNTLTPTSLTIPYNNGSPVFTDAKSEMKVFRDGLDVTKDWTYSISASGCSASLTGTYSNIINITAISADTATVYVTAHRTNWSNIISKVYVTKGSDKTYVDEQVAAIATLGTPAYRGRYQATHPTTYIPNDWWLVYDTDDSPITRGVYYSNAGTPTLITTSSTMVLQAKMVDALTDVAWAEANGYGTAASYGIETFYQSLGAVTAFINTLFAKTIVATGSISSSNYVAGTSGFQLDAATGALNAMNANIKGAVTATSGSFTGAVTATSGSFTGTVNASGGYFNSDDGSNRRVLLQNGYLYFQYYNGSTWITKCTLSAYASGLDVSGYISAGSGIYSNGNIAVGGSGNIFANGYVSTVSAGIYNTGFTAISNLFNSLNELARQTYRTYSCDMSLTIRTGAAPYVYSLYHIYSYEYITDSQITLHLYSVSMDGATAGTHSNMIINSSSSDIAHWAGGIF